MKEIKGGTEIVFDKEKRIQELEEENKQLKRQIEGYVCEFRVCRFCANAHGDCSPTDGSCRPKWGGL